MENEHLRTQRKLRGWSQEDLVRELVALGIELDERQLGVTRSQVSRWEHGVTHPRAPYPKLLCRVFNAGADELGLVSPSSPAGASITMEGTTIDDGGDDVERRDFLGVTGVAAMGAVLPWTVWPGMRSRASSSFTPSALQEGQTLEALTAITGSYRRLDDSTASLELLPLALGHLSHVSNAVQQSSSTAGRQNLLAAASEAAGLTAGLALDTGDHVQASSHYGTAITFAKQADNSLLQAFSLGMMSSFRAETRQGAKAVQLVEKGKSLLPRQVPPTIEARMATYEANAYASIGDARQALSALGRADTASERIQPDGEMFWPLVFPFDAGRRARERGACATRLKEPQMASPALQEGLGGLGPGPSKRRALILADLAESYVLTAEIEEACRVLWDACKIGSQLGSYRVLQRVREVRSCLTPYRDVPAVRDLDERMVGASDGKD